MNLEYCSPNNINNKISCFTEESLIIIAKQYNEKYPDDKIIISNKIDKEKFWKELIDKINKKTNCDNDLCILDLNFINKKKISDDFRPLRPTSWKNNKNTWLSTTDINNVLEQYETKHPDFKYIGAVPIDFDKKLMFGMCVVDELCKLNIKNLYFKGGIRKLSIVFNLDPHDKPGSHWVSLYVDLINGGIYYFDSYGHPPVKEICKLMERIRIQGNKLIEDNFLILNNEHDEIANILKINKNIVYIRNKKNNFKLDTPIYINNQLLKITKIKEMKDVIKLVLNNKIKDNNYNKIIQKGFRKFYNNIRFQYGGSECGMYSIYFQTQLLNGNKFTNVIKNIMDDETINNKRNYYYRPK